MVIDGIGDTSAEFGRVGTKVEPRGVASPATIDASAVLALEFAFATGANGI